MEIKDKNILIMGLGISGVSSAKALKKMGAKVIINDAKTEDELSDKIYELKGLDVEYRLDSDDIDLNGIDLIVKSPGIPLDVKIIKKAIKENIEVITDIELADRISTNTFVAITGTNGKTTTTTLIGEIIKKSDRSCRITGNIGVGILWEIVNSAEEDIFVIETSSFQLESIKKFKPKVSLIINITPDHIKWHKSFENYIQAKAKIFKNQNKSDYTVLNYDDPLVKELGSKVNSNIVYFSKETKLDYGIYIEGDNIVINDGEKVTSVMKYNKIRIPGKHNLENSLAAIAVSWVMGISIDAIKSTLATFEGVEHRLEFVEELEGIKFYNDSKGTNPDASIKAIEAINKPIILIAGGLDKGSDFTEFIESFDGKVKALVLLGETAMKIKETAINKGFFNICIVENMSRAVQKSYELSEKGDNVLLSPACASWDMYQNFEVRGKDFKEAVRKLRGI